MAQTTILGLSLPDWINLVISLLIVPIGYGIGALIAEVLLRWIARRTSPQVGEAISKAFGPSLRWLVAILVLSFATKRLTFLSPGLKATLGDVLFILGLILSVRIVWSLIDLAHDWQRKALEQAGRVDELDQVLILFTRIARI